MARHNATKVLPLSNQTKLTLTVTLTLTDTVTLNLLYPKIYPHFVDGWCYLPSARTEIKCHNSLLFVREDGNL